MAPSYSELESELLEAIAGWDPVDGPARWSDERFDRLARRIFAFQYAESEAVRAVAQSRSVAPDDVETHRDLPAVATDVFKRAEVKTGPAERVFRTSGTTGTERGAHHMRSLELYRAALHPPFVRYCVPDRREFRLFAVAPSPSRKPDSSLSYMLGELCDRIGDRHSGFADEATDGAGGGFDFDWLVRQLDRADSDDAPVLLFGTALGFAAFFERTSTSWKLPADSRAVETGGFKGRDVETTREELYDAFERRLGIPSRRVAGEYGMTELTSQAYTDNLRRIVRGDSADVEPPGGRPFFAPPWARIDIVDPGSMEPLREPGARGLIRWYDLANLGSSVAMQTSDLGRITEDGGVVHLGRASDADLRGCSLTAEELAE